MQASQVNGTGSLDLSELTAVGPLDGCVPLTCLARSRCDQPIIPPASSLTEVDLQTVWQQSRRTTADVQRVRIDPI